MTPTRAKRRGLVAPRRGVALIAALATIVVLATVTTLASRSARASAALVTNRRAQMVATQLAESGVLAARARVEALLVAAGSDSAARMRALDEMLAELEQTDPDGTPRPWAADTLGDGVFAATIVNVTARFDVNSGDVEGLARLFGTAAPPAEAMRAAQRLGAYVRGDGDDSDGRRRTDRALGAEADAARSRDSLVQALLGRSPVRGTARRFDTLDEVAAFLGADAPWLASVATYLTVDGDGRVDRRHAAPAVLRAAAGSLVDQPTRLLIVSRGWQPGHLLTREIQAVYAIEGNALPLVTWREQTR
jgi:hypothetical protein